MCCLYQIHTGFSRLSNAKLNVKYLNDYFYIDYMLKDGCFVSTGLNKLYYWINFIYFNEATRKCIIVDGACIIFLLHQQHWSRSMWLIRGGVVHQPRTITHQLFPCLRMVKWLTPNFKGDWEMDILSSCSILFSASQFLLTLLHASFLFSLASPLYFIPWSFPWLSSDAYELPLALLPFLSFILLSV